MDAGGQNSNGSYSPFPTDISSFFGGSFFSQVNAETRDKLLQFLPKVSGLDDDALLAELAANSDSHLSDNDDGFGQIDTATEHGVD